MVKKFQINLSNKVFYTLITIGVIVLLGIGVYAYGSAVPTTMGHSSEEITVEDPLCIKISGHDCGYDTDTDTTIPDTNTWRPLTDTECNVITGHDCGYDTDTDTDTTIPDTNTWRPLNDAACTTITGHACGYDTDTDTNTNTWRPLTDTECNVITGHDCGYDTDTDTDTTIPDTNTWRPLTDTECNVISGHDCGYDTDTDTTIPDTNTWRPLNDAACNIITGHDCGFDNYEADTDTDTTVDGCSGCLAIGSEVSDPGGLANGDDNTWRPLNDAACNIITGHDCGYDDYEADTDTNTWRARNTDYALQARDGSPTNVVYVDTSGEVGIGTTSPETLLDVHYDGAINGVHVWPLMVSTNFGTTTSDFGGLGIKFMHEQDATRRWAGIMADAESTWANDVGLAFYTSGNSHSEKVRITSDGDVGIGTPIPSTGLKLDVEGSVGATSYCDGDGNNCKSVTEMGGRIPCGWTGWSSAGTGVNCEWICNEIGCRDVITMHCSGGVIIDSKKTYVCSGCDCPESGF